MFLGHFDPIWIGRTWVGPLQITYKDENGLNQPIPQDELEAVTFRGGLYHGDCRSPVLTASTGAGLTVRSDGVVDWRIDPATTAGLCPGLYTLKLDITDGTDTEPLFELSIPVRS